MSRNLEKLKERVLGIDIDYDTPTGALTYSLAQFINMLREREFPIPSSTSRDIIAVIDGIARDPAMHVKLLDADWLKTLLKSFVAKDEDQSRRFDIHFGEALEIGSRREEAREKGYHNNAMATLGNIIHAFPGMGGFTHNYKMSESSKQEVEITKVISDLVYFLDKKGYKTDGNPFIEKKIPSSFKIVPLKANLMQIIKEQMQHDVEAFHDEKKADSWLENKDVKRIKKLNFNKEDFNEAWMNRVLRRVYGKERSLKFGAAIDEFLMMERQKTIADDESSEEIKEGGSNPNVLLGAINDYLISIHGTSVPRIYDFPLKNANITENIDKDAATDASALFVGEKSYEDIRKRVLPRKFGSNIVERSLYMRALKRHVRSNFADISDMVMDIDDYELEMIATGFLELDKRNINESYDKSIDDGLEIDRKSLDDYINFSASTVNQKELEKDRTGIVHGVKDDDELRKARIGRFIELAVKRKDIEWTFKTGNNAGKTVKIETIKDYVDFRKELKREREGITGKISNAYHDGFENVLGKKGTAFFTMDDLRDLDDVANQLPDGDLKNAIKELIGDADKYSEDLASKINAMMLASKQGDSFKGKFSNELKRIDIPVRQVKELRGFIKKSGKADILVKLDSMVDKKFTFSPGEMMELKDLFGQVAPSDKKKVSSTFADAEISITDMEKLKNEAGKSGKKDTVKKLDKISDINQFSKKEIDRLLGLLESINDDATARKITSSMSSMKFLKSKGKSIKKLVEGVVGIDAIVSNILDTGNVASIADIKKLDALADSILDTKVKRKVKNAIDSLTFSVAGMNDVISIVGTMDGKNKASFSRFFKKKVNFNDIDEIMSIVDDLEGGSGKSRARDIIESLQFGSAGIDPVSTTIDNIENKYDWKKSIFGIVDGKILTFTGKEAIDLEKLVDEISNGNGENARAVIDASRFTPGKVSSLRDLLGKMDDEEKIRKKIQDLLDGVHGKEVPRSKADNIKSRSNNASKDMKGKIDDIIDRAVQNGNKQQRDAMIDFIKSRVDEMERSLDDNKNKLQASDKSTWEYGKELIKFWKKRIESMSNGMEDPSSMFENMENGMNSNVVLRRLAKTEGAEQVAMDWMESFYKIFNKFAEKASDDEQKALFASQATSLNRGKQKITELKKQIELSKEKQEEVVKANDARRKIKEGVNDTLLAMRKYFESQGLDFADCLAERTMWRVQTDQAANQIIPPGNATRLDFGNREPDKCISGSTVSRKDSRRFLFPDLRDVTIFSGYGDENTPWATLNYMGDEAGDQIIARLEQFGNYDREKAIKNLLSEKEGPPESDEGKTSIDDLSFIDDFIEKTKKLTREDATRDWSRKFGDTMAETLMPNLFKDLSGKSSIPSLKDQLDLEGDIDMPRPPNPFGKNADGGQTITQETRDPNFGGGKRGGIGSSVRGGMQGGDGSASTGARVGRGAGKSFTGTGGLSPTDTGEVEQHPEYVNIGGGIDAGDLDIERLTMERMDDLFRGRKELEGAEYDGTGTFDPQEWFKEGKILDLKTIDEMMKEMIERPDNAAIMRKRFRSFFRDDRSRIMKLKHGKIMTQRIDRRALVRRNLRNGVNPRNDKIVVTNIPRKTAKNVKNDIFAVDISGSMYSYVAVASQLIASLTDPAYLQMVAFDTDAIAIDPSIFRKNPAIVFKSLESVNEFVKATAMRKNRKWEGSGGTSYDSAMRELQSLNVSKGDRVIFIGDLEHNTTLPENITPMFDLWIKNGKCKRENDYGDCIAEWFSDLCRKADSCIAINPKSNVGDDLTCEFIGHDIPTCFTGALSGKGGKATEIDNHVLGEGLARTVDCLRMGMTGEKPKISKKILDFCDAKSKGRTRSSSISPY